MTTALSTGVLLLVFAAPPAAAPGWSPGVAGRTNDVTGTWSVTVHGSGAHHELHASMTLQQDGRRVTGTLAVHGNEHTMSGEIEDATLRLAIEHDSHDEITLTATMEDDGTLAGYLSGPMGDVQWTAVRAKAQQ